MSNIGGHSNAFYSDNKGRPPLKRLLIKSFDSEKGIDVRSSFERMCIDRGFKIVSENPDVVVSVGGDGTMLRAVREYGESGLPLVGINAGRLGFLPNFNSDESSLLELLNALEQGNYRIINRPLLDVEMVDEMGEIYRDFAFNEVVVKYSNMKMMDIGINIDKVLFNHFTGDGIVVSTPLGTTGYAIWAGAAVLNPDMPCYQLTPINPNNSSVNNPLLYSLVIPEQQLLYLEIFNENKNMVVVSCDGNTVQNKLFSSISIGISNRKVKVIESFDYDYWAVFKSKILDKNLTR